MARALTEKQQKLLAVLFDEAGGDIVAAKKIAGYSDATSSTEIINSLKDEILDATSAYMARNAPKLVKTEKMQVEAKGGVMLMPPKQVEED
jgi:transposase